MRILLIVLLITIIFMVACTPLEPVLEEKNDSCSPKEVVLGSGTDILVNFGESKNYSCGEVMTEEMAIIELMKAGCFWSLDDERVSVKFVDPNWEISATDCGGVCAINAETKEIFIDENPMCMGLDIE